MDDAQTGGRPPDPSCPTDFPSVSVSSLPSFFISNTQTAEFLTLEDLLEGLVPSRDSESQEQAKTWAGAQKAHQSATPPPGSLQAPVRPEAMSSESTSQPGRFPQALWEGPTPAGCRFFAAC